jgi:hypothetical protein
LVGIYGKIGAFGWLWFWKEKVAFGLVVLVCLCFAIKYPHLAINIRYSGIFFASMKLRFNVCPLGPVGSFASWLKRLT